jgi:L-2,4-diaminobutyrate decarboxylase
MTKLDTPVGDASFAVDEAGLHQALALLGSYASGQRAELPVLPAELPDHGIGEAASLDTLAPLALGGARRLGEPSAFAHMDPPTPWITWATALWNASLNQNLLHPDTAPVAREIEHRSVAWLAPFFGMDGGHLVPGSTVANITALWAARERVGVRRVVAAETAHLSVAKAAHLLGLAFEPLPVDERGVLDASHLPQSMDDAALVLTAGATSTGAIDPLHLTGQAAWTHVDAAWAGPLRLSTLYAERLSGLECADSVAVSAHKWLFQPKESAYVLFRDSATAHAAISFGGAYLAVPNVGLLGSHGAAALPLLATLLAWGRRGLAERVERCMANAEAFAEALAQMPGARLWGMPQTGIVVWRPNEVPAEVVQSRLPVGMASLTTIGGERWLRNVSANPNADVQMVIEAVQRALRS